MPATEYGQIRAPKHYPYKGFHFVEHQVSVNERIDGVRNHVDRYAYYGGKILTKPQIQEHIEIALKRGVLQRAA